MGVSPGRFVLPLWRFVNEWVVCVCVCARVCSNLGDQVLLFSVKPIGLYPRMFEASATVHGFKPGVKYVCMCVCVCFGF